MSASHLTMRSALHASPLDARRGVVRLHPLVLSALGLRAWDPVELTGRRTTAALVALAAPDAPQSVLFMDELVLSNAGLVPGDPVRVRPAHVEPASSVVLSGLPPGSRPDPEGLRLALLGKVVGAGDEVSLLPQDFARPDDGPAGADLEQLVHALTRDLGAGWQQVLLRVAAAEPEGSVRVTMETLVAIDGVSATASSATPLSTGASGVPAVSDLPWLAVQADALREWFTLGFHHTELLTRLGAGPQLGVLLSGAPGAGKVTLVRAAAQAVHARVVHVWGRAVAALEPDAARQMLHAKLSEAAKRPPAVLLVEDVEALAPRDDASVLLTVFLEVVAKAVGQQRLAVVCTTSHPERVSPELRRPGVLDHELALPMPDRTQRRQILEVLSRTVALAPDVDFEVLAARTPGFVTADLHALCREAALRAALRLSGGRVHGVAAVGHADFLGALDVVRPSAVDRQVLDVGDVTLDDVGDMAETKRVLTELVIWPLAYPETFERLGIEPARGVLLFGPPGCGKTYVVTALANAAQANFFAVKGAELLSKWVGESERAVRELFRRAREAAPSLIFFDEIDALAPARGIGSDEGSTDRVVAQLLTELDGVEQLRGVFVVAATNRPDLVDPALLRPGRFDRLVHVPPPDADARGAILAAVTRSMPCAPGIDFAGLAAECEGYSAADLEALAREAAMTAMRESLEAPAVTAAHFAQARTVVRASIRSEAVAAAERFAAHDGH